MQQCVDRPVLRGRPGRACGHHRRAKILFGSDWPHGEGLESLIDYTAELTAFGADDVRKIMRDNAIDLLGAKATSAA